jgi:hypothetical protein
MKLTALDYNSYLQLVKLLLGESLTALLKSVHRPITVVTAFACCGGIVNFKSALNDLALLTQLQGSSRYVYDRRLCYS